MFFLNQTMHYVKYKSDRFILNLIEYLTFEEIKAMENAFKMHSMTFACHKQA